MRPLRGVKRSHKIRSVTSSRPCFCLRGEKDRAQRVRRHFPVPGFHFHRLPPVPCAPCYRASDAAVFVCVLFDSYVFSLIRNIRRVSSLEQIARLAPSPMSPTALLRPRAQSSIQRSLDSVLPSCGHEEAFSSVGGRLRFFFLVVNSTPGVLTERVIDALRSGIDASRFCRPSRSLSFNQKYLYSQTRSAAGRRHRTSFSLRASSCGNNCSDEKIFIGSHVFFADGAGASKRKGRALLGPSETALRKCASNAGGSEGVLDSSCRNVLHRCDCYYSPSTAPERDAATGRQHSHPPVFIPRSTTILY